MAEEMVKKEYYNALRMRADRLEALCKKLRDQNKELETRNEYLWKMLMIAMDKNVEESHNLIEKRLNEN